MAGRKTSSSKESNGANEIKPGQLITGRWSRLHYRILRRLGKGAIGTVYLAQERGRTYALKIASDANGIALEYRLLRLLQNKHQTEATNRVHGFRLGPFVSNLDDLVTSEGNTSFFYVMEYIEGVPVDSFVRLKGIEAVYRIVIQLLGFLYELHNLGYAFGDLKSDNILVNPQTGDVRLIDFGGATRFDQSIRQYTEWNDRGYWLGESRRAEQSYDLFAVAMLIVQLVRPTTKSISKQNGELSHIRALVAACLETKMWLPLLEKAWTGKYQTAQQMYLEVLTLKPHIESVYHKKGKSFLKAINHELSRDWDWSHWVLTGSAVIYLTVIMRLLVVQ